MARKSKQPRVTKKTEGKLDKQSTLAIQLVAVVAVVAGVYVSTVYAPNPTAEMRPPARVSAAQLYAGVKPHAAEMEPHHAAEMELPAAEVNPMQKSNRQLLEDFYREHKPQNVEHVDSMLQDHATDLKGLMRSIAKVYGTAPKLSMSATVLGDTNSINASYSGGWGTASQEEMVINHCDIEERWDDVSAADFYYQAIPYIFVSYDASIPY
jgi:hypothetical protein